MLDVDAKLADLLESPIGCDFLDMADASGLSPKEIAEPVVSIYMCAFALHDTVVWGAYRELVLKEAFRRGRQYPELGRSILQQPAAAWWFAPLDTDQQVWVSREGIPPEPAQLITPNAPPSRWERYAQKTENHFFTSTLIQGASSIYAAHDEKVGDIGIGWPELPLKSWRLKAVASARIFEIDGPKAWHDLCVRYPAEGGKNSNEPDFSGDEGRLVPDWHAVADDWDAVHLTFGGLLASEQVRVESQGGWTYLCGWDIEGTLWLRWMFTEIERMPDHEPVTPLQDLVHPEIRSRRLPYLRDPT